ncbi:MAG: transcriptional regulator, partial [Cyanobacteria bacterium J06648_11]
MTLTFDSDSYAALLTRYRPKAIVTEEENEAAVALAEELEHCSPRSPEEEALLDLLTILIERFEEEHYPIPEGTPQSMVLHLLEARELKQEALVGVVGSRGVVSEIVNGKRGISKNQAKMLAEFF